MNPKVSVIVPVYNVENYLDECLNSLVNQSLEELEIIVVNDGSTDGSQLVIDKFRNNYPTKIKSYSKTNGGLSDARNFGLKYATADYIGFIDSDDFVEFDMYEKMYNLAIDHYSDLVVCDLEYSFEDITMNYVMSGINQKANSDIKKSVFLSPLFAWNKLYHKELFVNNDLRYPVGLWYEDIPVTLPIFALANNIQYLPEVKVHYRQRSTSIMGSKTNDKMYDIFTVLMNSFKWFKQKGLFINYKNELEYLAVEHWVLYGSFRFLRSDDYRNLCQRAFKNLHQEFPNWKKNIYLKTLKSSYQVYLKTMSPLLISVYHFLLKWRDQHA